jgi:hypothetical protein
MEKPELVLSIYWGVVKAFNAPEHPVVMCAEPASEMMLESEVVVEMKWAKR